MLFRSLELDFLQYQPKLRLSKSGENTYVYDPIRKKDVVLQPEELLRQLVLQYLLEEKKCPPHRIRSEIGIEVNGLKKRCDIVVYKADNPWMIIECKEMNVLLDKKVLDQVLRYNIHLQVPYLIITNGTYCYAFAVVNNKLEELDELPA